jgi:hypothetical protein
MSIPQIWVKWYLAFCLIIVGGFYYYTARGQSVVHQLSGRAGAHKGASQFHK